MIIDQINMIYHDIHDLSYGYINSRILSKILIQPSNVPRIKDEANHEVWALSVQKCEFFHADVHAGNLLVLED